MTPERKAERAAARKREKELDKLVSIARDVHVSPTDYLTLEFDGVVIKGFKNDFNKVVEKLGLRPVRITNNMLNPEAGKFCVDINTPSYCDPGCESYHTM
jgi:hypothetical protein